jgi:hypothetical protein
MTWPWRADGRCSPSDFDRSDLGRHPQMGPVDVPCQRGWAISAVQEGPPGPKDLVQAAEIVGRRSVVEDVVTGGGVGAGDDGRVGHREDDQSVVRVAARSPAGEEHPGDIAFAVDGNGEVAHPAGQAGAAVIDAVAYGVGGFADEVRHGAAPKGSFAERRPGAPTSCPSPTS